MSSHNASTASLRNYSHILIITLNENLSDIDKSELVDKINNTINEKKIYKDLGNHLTAGIEWMFSNSDHAINEFVYITNVNGILGDKAVLMHTKKVIKDMEIVDKCKIRITKPLTKKIAMF